MIPTSISTDKTTWTEADHKFFEAFERYLDSLGLPYKTSDDPDFDFPRFFECMKDYYSEDDTPYEFTKLDNGSSHRFDNQDGR